MLWSILIAAIPDRFHTVSPLLYSLLETQGVARHPDVELLYLLDSRRRSVGAKRNVLLDAARGDYVSFIDDDDMVSGDYVARVLDALKRNPGVDVVCFPQRATLTPGGIIHECCYSLDCWKRPSDQRRQLAATDRPNVFAWTGPPAHTMVWRMGRGVGAPRFPETQFGEDVVWVDQMCAGATTEAQIEGPPAYFYQFDAERSATRG